MSERLGYVSSGQHAADCKREEAERFRHLGRVCFRAHCPNQGRAYLRSAILAWRNYRHFLSKVKQ